MFTDVDTPVVHCQRHILVYHFVYLRPTQGAYEYSYAHGGYSIGAGELLSACDCYCIWGDTSEGGFEKADQETKENPALTGLLRRDIADHVLGGEAFTLTKTAMRWKVHFGLTIFSVIPKTA